jgi:hypothetical protein
MGRCDSQQVDKTTARRFNFHVYGHVRIAGSGDFDVFGQGLKGSAGLV